MKKVESFLPKLFFYISALAGAVNVIGLGYIHFLKGYSADVHTLQKWEMLCALGSIVWCIVFIICSISLIAFSELGTALYNKYLAPKLQKLPIYASGQIQPPEMEPILDRTSQAGRDTQKIVVSDKFRDLFMPEFCRTNDMGINPYTIMTQHLKQGSWTLTDLGRVARMCYQADAHNPRFQFFNEWMKEFFDKLGRTDCPASPEKKNYKICEDSPLIKTFNCIVKFGEKKKTDYIKSLNR